MLFSKNLKRTREERGKTQRDVAEHLGVAVQTVDRWERNTIPQPRYIDELVKFLGTSMSELWTEPKRSKRGR